MKNFTLVTVLGLTLLTSSQNIPDVSTYLAVLTVIDMQISEVASQLQTFSVTPNTAHATSVIGASETLVSVIDAGGLVISASHSLTDSEALQLVQPLEDVRDDFNVIAESAVAVEPLFRSLSLFEFSGVHSQMHDVMQEENTSMEDLMVDLDYKVSELVTPIFDAIGSEISYEIQSAVIAYETVL